MARIQERISSIVESQFPEFISTDYPKFTAFVKAYYQFLEQDQGAFEIVQNAQKYSDIDYTTEPFVQYILDNYGKDFPHTAQVDRRLLVKKLNDIYESKGSAQGFQTLFRVLYDKNVEVKRPYEFVLRPSDGIWEQRLSIRARLVSGSFSNIVNRVLLLKKNGLTYKSTILKVRDINSTLCEIFISSNSIAPFELYDTVTVESATGVIFTGTVDPTLTDYTIVDAGANFKIGQIFNVNLSGGVDSAVKITGVDASGGITNLKFIKYGHSFTDNITVNLLNSLFVSTTTKSFQSKTDGFSESILGVKPHTSLDPDRYFFSDYVEGSGYYTGSVVIYQNTSQSLTGGTTETTEIPENAAVITFIIGAIGRYPGQYNSTQGFPSEPGVNLQDSKLYQPFAYQLETEEDINVFYTVVKNLVHPAGTSMFNNRTINSTIDINSELTLATEVTEA